MPGDTKTAKKNDSGSQSQKKPGDEVTQKDAFNSKSYENMTDACQGIKQEFVSSLVRWTRALNDSEKFDVFFEKRIDTLIKEAEDLEENLKTQKNALKERLKCLTKTLTQVIENES